MAKQKALRWSDLLSRLHGNARHPQNNVELGFEAMEWFYIHAVLAAERHRESGQLLSPTPDVSNPRGDSLSQCQANGGEAFTFLAHRVGRNAMLKAIDTVLRRHRPYLSTKVRSLIPLFSKLMPQLDRDLYKVGKLLLIDAVAVHDEAVARAELHLCAYALIGFSLKKTPKPATQPCKYCCFRLQRPNSTYCTFHRMSHARRGEDNVFASVPRQKKITETYLEYLDDIRLRYGNYRIGLPSAEYQWAPYVDSYIVTQRSVKWLEQIFSECPELDALIGREIMTHIAGKRWAKIFELLRKNIDPNDLRVDLEVWCDKLVSAQAWIAVAKPITGEYKEKQVRSRIGKVLRSGQHVGGKRGPKSLTTQKMNKAKKLAEKGLSIQMIANQMGETPKTVRQWRSRHPGFAESLSFYWRRSKEK